MLDRTLTRLLAATYPRCQAIGIDRVARLLELASTASSGLSNLQFIVWDYGSMNGKPEIRAEHLVSSLGIDFSPHPTDLQSLDAYELRQCLANGQALAEVTSYFAALAMAIYRSLGDRIITESRSRTFDDGHAHVG